MRLDGRDIDSEAKRRNDVEANFKQCLAWVRESEGGNDDDKDDSGGRTSRGITQREYDAYNRIAGLRHGDVWKAPDGVINDIYHKSYWNPYCPQMPPGIDYMLFDDGVLSGPVTAHMTLQRALGVNPDGHIGVVTSAALIHADPAQLIKAIGAARLARYEGIIHRRPKDAKFRRGWRNRVEFAEKNALTLLEDKVG
jgi:lysozyme family protein